MAKGKFVVNPSFEKLWQFTPEAKQIAERSAKEIAAAAKRNTHASIAAGIEVEVGMEDGQITGRVNSKDFRSHWFEFGTSEMSAQPFLQPAVTALGYKLKARRKRR